MTVTGLRGLNGTITFTSVKAIFPSPTQRKQEREKQEQTVLNFGSDIMAGKRKKNQKGRRKKENQMLIS